MRYLIPIYLIWSAVSDFFAAKLSVLSYVDELIVSILFLDLLMHAIANAGRTRKKSAFSMTAKLIMALVVWSCLSCLQNGSSIAQLCKFLFSVSKGFIIFYWLRTFLKDEKMGAQLEAIIKWAIIVQIPFFIFGLIVFRGGYFGDNAVGAIITGDASSVGTYFWLGIMICLAKYESRSERRYLIFALGLALLLIITSTKQLTVLLPVVLLYLYGRRFKAGNFKKLVYVGFGVIAVVMLYNTVERRWMMNYGVDTQDVNLLDYVNESEKILGYYSLIFELPNEIKHPLSFGAGPGMYGSYVAMNARTPLAQKYIMYYYDRIPDGMGGSLAYRSSSVIGFWGDLGLVGLCLIVLIYAYHTFHFGKRMKAMRQPSMYNLIIATGLLLLAQSFILNVFEGNTFTLNLFWILCGVSAAGSSRPAKDSLTEICV